MKKTHPPVGSPKERPLNRQFLLPNLPFKYGKSEKERTMAEKKGGRDGKGERRSKG